MIDIAWLSSCEVGSREIDAEHERLLDALTAMREAFAGGHYHACRRLLDRCIDQVEAHFTREEALFGSFDYPGARRHADQHGVLSLRLKAIARSASDLDLPPRILADLIDGVAAVVMTDHLTLDLELKQHAPAIETAA